jgi:hypothetical protein
VAGKASPQGRTSRSKRRGSRKARLANCSARHRVARVAQGPGEHGRVRGAAIAGRENLVENGDSRLAGRERRKLPDPCGRGSDLGLAAGVLGGVGRRRLIGRGLRPLLDLDIVEPGRATTVDHQHGPHLGRAVGDSAGGGQPPPIAGAAGFLRRVGISQPFAGPVHEGQRNVGPGPVADVAGSQLRADGVGCPAFHGQDRVVGRVPAQRRRVGHGQAKRRVTGMCHFAVDAAQGLGLPTGRVILFEAAVFEEVRRSRKGDRQHQGVTSGHGSIPTRVERRPAPPGA